MPIDEAPRILGFIFGISVVFLVPFLLIRRRFPRKVRLAVLAAAILSGVLLFAPMTPLLFMAGLYQLKDFRASLIFVLAVFSIFIITALLLGRSFCGYACPIGAAQEIPYWLPGRKWIIRQSYTMMIIRGIIISIFILLSMLAIIHLIFTSLLLMHGVRDIFLLSPSGLPSLLFLTLLLLSVFLYRPFCRYACPYGALMSLAAWKSLFRIQRTLQCTGCGACEAVCPTGEYQHGKQGNECYLCSRCQDICSVKGGIEYQAALRSSGSPASRPLRPVCWAMEQDFRWWFQK